LSICQPAGKKILLEIVRTVNLVIEGRELGIWLEREVAQFKL
jgi:hypothetical protein